MLVLAFETSVDPCGIALADDQGIVTAVRFRHHMDLSSTWAAEVQRMLSGAGASPRQLDGVAASLGPGSFTGLRIGVVAAKSMAQALRCRLVGISSLELLALPFRCVDGLSVLSLVPCRRGEAYAAVYRAEGGELVEASAPAVVPVEGLSSLLESLPKPRVAVGKPVLRGDDAAVGLRIDPWHTASSAEVLALEAVRRMSAGAHVDPAHLLPVYVKRSQAEERLAAGTLTLRRHL